MPTAILLLASTLALARLGYFTLAGLTPRTDLPMVDFRDATYFPVRELWTSGGMPYDPAKMFAHWPVKQEFDLYLPAHLLIFSPLALLEFRAAAFVMFVANAIILVMLAHLSAQAATSKPYQRLVFAGILATLILGQIGKAQLVLGQLNPLVALGVLLSLTTSTPPRRSLGLALTWLKPQFGLFLALYLFYTGRRREAVQGTFIAFIMSLPVVFVLLLRTGGPAGFIDVLRANVDYATRTGYGSVSSPGSSRIDIVSVIARLTQTSPSGAWEPLLALVTLALAIWLRCRGPGGLFRQPQTLLCLVWLLIGVVHQPGDVLILTPFLAATTLLLVSPTAVPRRLLLGSAVALLLVPHLLINAINAPIQTIAGTRIEHLVPGVFVILGTLVLTAWFLGSTSAAPPSPLSERERNVSP